MSTSPIRMVSVPAEPTEAMWEAARKAWHDHKRPYTFDCTKAAFRAMLTAAPVREEGGAVDDLVVRFAAALKEKLHAAEAKHGHNDAWLRDDWRDDLIYALCEHVAKGDPRDVAAYCAFAWHHNWSLAAGQEGNDRG